MSMTRGERFGPYEIGESIGAGGMGEVYRATDVRLKRDVAIKVLPDAFVDDDQRLARFQREAEVLASLNHASIAHLYGLERSGAMTALVMELVEGVNARGAHRARPVAAEGSRRHRSSRSPPRSKPRTSAASCTAI